VINRHWTGRVRAALFAIENGIDLSSLEKLNEIFNSSSVNRASYCKCIQRVLSVVMIETENVRVRTTSKSEE